MPKSFKAQLKKLGLSTATISSRMSELPRTNALILDEKAGRALMQMRAYARTHIVPYGQMKMRMHLLKTNAMLAALMVPDRHIKVEVGYRVAYAIEEGAPGIPCHHLVACGPNLLPHPDALTILMKLFGYPCELLDCLVFTEEVAERRNAVNVVMPLSGDLDALLNATEDEPSGTIH